MRFGQVTDVGRVILDDPCRLREVRQRAALRTFDELEALVPPKEGGEHGLEVGEHADLRSGERHLVHQAGGEGVEEAFRVAAAQVGKEHRVARVDVHDQHAGLAPDPQAMHQPLLDVARRLAVGVDELRRVLAGMLRSRCAHERRRPGFPRFDELGEGLGAVEDDHGRADRRLSV